ncbi:hypothetical protein [Castellaniella sp.]|uniref:hypothetical protein n=1 Tax=Castellaniella sp. TaxID=1955812 RepID=UPI003A956ECF
MTPFSQSLEPPQNPGRFKAKNRCELWRLRKGTIDYVATVRVQEAASYRIEEIYRYTREHWGTQQANRYIAVDQFKEDFGL